MSLTNKQLEAVNLLKGTLPTAPAEIAQENVTWYKPWVAKESVKKGDRRWEEVSEEKILFECIAPEGLDEGTNLYSPSEAPAIWKRVWLEEYPWWVQPLGAHDAYPKGAKVSHGYKEGTEEPQHWISDIDANTYEPGVYGWTRSN